MNRRWFGAIGTLGLGLLLGVFFSPALRSGTANAQAPAAQASAAPSASPQARPSSAASSLRNQFLDQLAAELNIGRPALDSAIAAAGSSTVDGAVKQGTLTQAQADALKARIQAGDLAALWGGLGGPKGGHSLGRVRQAMIDAAAKKLGLTVEEFRTRLRSGQTLAQLAPANNTTERAVVDAALAATKTALDQAVADGTVTQARADAIYAGLQQRGADLFTWRGRGPGREHRPRSPGASPAPTATPAG